MNNLLQCGALYKSLWIAVNLHPLLIFSDNNPFCSIPLAKYKEKLLSWCITKYGSLNRMRWFLESSTQSSIYILTTEKVMLVTIFKIDIGSLIVQD